MVAAMSKAVSAMTMQGCSTSSRGTQYKGASSYISREWQSQLAHGAKGTVQLSVTCFYCKDTGHIKNNCVWLNKKNHARTSGPRTGDSSKKGHFITRYYSSSTKNGSADLGPV